LDELDSLTPTRGSGFGDSHVTERVVSQLLTEVDGLEKLKNVIVIGATNRPELIDLALLRAGRLGKSLEVPIPDREARLEILKIHTRKKPLKDDVNLEEFAEELDGKSGADIAEICNEASLQAVREFIDKHPDIDEVKEEVKTLTINKSHFKSAMKQEPDNEESSPLKEANKPESVASTN
jgi:transitional endoplasmic reticulum ATPase